jgi:hypothetical protein
MSNVNDNNLDDLLRRAAEKYPLRTDSADWGRMMADLDNDPSMILPTVNGEDTRRRRRFFWLFLLLPLAGVGYYTWHGAGAGKQIGKGDQAIVKGRAPGQFNQPGEKGKIDPVSASRQNDPSGENGLNDLGGDNKQNGVAGGKTHEDIANSKAKIDPAARAPRETEQGIGEGGSREKAGADVPANQSVTGTKEIKRGHSRGAATGIAAGITTGAAAGAASNGTNANEETTKTTADDALLHLAGNNVQRANTKMKGDVTANQPKSATKKDDIKLQKPKPSFYVGVLAAPDLSTVKWQSIKDVGGGVGLLLGYSFNSRWAIESGVYYTKKKYYTDGEYFDKTNAWMLKYVDQLKIDGVCHMWEFPLNVRYNLSTGEKMKWFATAGASAYYMPREIYDCTGYYNGMPWAKGWDQKPTHNKWSSNLNFSIGYEQRLGKIGNLRLEPYVRVPMSGIGTGNLSIMSAGLNIGITRRIW